MRLSRRRPAPAEVVDRAALAADERILAATATRDGSWLLGGRTALHVVPPGGRGRRIPWEQVESADWSRDDDRLRVTEVGEYGARRPVHEFRLDDPGELLPFVRERVTASVVLQRRVLVADRQGFYVVARRSPGGGDRITWSYEFDAGVDPADPEVRRLAETGLRAAAEELGLA